MTISLNSRDKNKYIDGIIVFAKSPGYKPIVMRINNRRIQDPINLHIGKTISYIVHSFIDQK